ncbi:extradiol dioxygenase [Blastococcus sp. TBT05-19]|uniref:VOC family protein n=1 Tax=Blastococcus sp. TBT05-19 TaxID=2250581 RepID=UPI000DE877C0|nr:VOC family protein [Blastococcus sp. TBT05-19]RBY90120.1 extradiol dioxygenase [Blastococcus sp. TBT05-19]
MPGTVSAIVVTPDIERLRAFYVGLLDAAEEERVPAEGPLFYLGLGIGDSRLGLVADADVTAGSPGRVLLSIEVPDVDALLPRVRELGGSAPAPSNDMPWGQRVAHVSDPDGNALNLTQQL